MIEVLREARSHPDAAWIHAQVRQRLPSVSLGTVYRTLDALVRDGVIMTLERAGQATRYDYKREDDHHFHAVCRCCGAIFDVEAPASLKLPAVTLPGGFNVADVQLEFVGTCADCQRHTN